MRELRRLALHAMVPAVQTCAPTISAPSRESVGTTSRGQSVSRFYCWNNSIRQTGPSRAQWSGQVDDVCRRCLDDAELGLQLGVGIHKGDQAVLLG